MIDLYAVRLAVLFAVTKGTAIALATSLLDIEFWKALIIAVISAVIGVSGALLAAYIAVREGRRVRNRVEDVAAKVGASRRASDLERSKAAVERDQAAEERELASKERRKIIDQVEKDADIE